MTINNLGLLSLPPRISFSFVDYFLEQTGDVVKKKMTEKNAVFDTLVKFHAWRRLAGDRHMASAEDKDAAGKRVLLRNSLLPRAQSGKITLPARMPAAI
jgi:hypothetical protein